MPAGRPPANTVLELVWEEPPARTSKDPSSIYDEALLQLKNKPDTWARLREFSGAGSAHSARKMLMKKEANKPFEFQAVAYKDGEQRADVNAKSALYARYVTRGKRNGS
jgi:hypothetical protein